MILSLALGKGGLPKCKEGQMDYWKYFRIEVLDDENNLENTQIFEIDGEVFYGNCLQAHVFYDKRCHILY